MFKEITMILLLATFVGVAGPSVAQTERKPPVVNVAIVTDGPSERVTSLRALFLDEMRTVNGGEFDIRAPGDLQIDGDWTLAGVRQALDRVLDDSRTGLVVTLGVMASHLAAHRANLTKPVLAPFVTNHTLQNLPYKDGASGKDNLSYVSLDVDIQRDLKVFRGIVPFTQLAFMLDNATAEAVPGIHEKVVQAARELGIKVTYIVVESSAEQAFAAVPTDTQAVYVGPLLRLSSDQYQRLIVGLIKRHLPSFAFAGKSDVERGLLVGVGPPLQMERLARRVALNARRILLGEKPSTLPVAFAREEGLTINMRTARAIGFSPSWRLLTSAELLHDEAEVNVPPLSLTDAVREAVKLNLDLRIAQTNVAAGKENIRQARSALLPRIGIGGRHNTIEEDDAAAIPGGAERTTSGSIRLDQTLYSEPAWANLTVQKQLQTARESDREQVRLDIVLDTAQAYLNVLRAKTNERVQKDNLRLTRSNLEMARARRRIGTAGPSEVYRWESEIANAQRAVVEAQSQLHVTQISLNVLLHRPLEAAVSTVDVGLDEPVLIASQKRLYALIDNPADFRLLRDFLVKDAFAAVPELQQLDALISAQERTLVSAERAFWSPTVSLQADRSEIFARSGTRGPAIPGVDDHESSLSLQLSLPLVTSGARGAQKQKAFEELAGLRLQRQAVAVRVEQRVRAALYNARAAYTAIRLSRDAAAAAESNLDVVRSAYSRGAISILDLLDAQNAALVADLRSSTAVYNFLRDLMEVERASARFDFFLTPQDQSDWFVRVERYFAEQGVAAPNDQ
jgi:outer membrane protein